MPEIPIEEVIWTALPNGLAVSGVERKLQLSVLVSPRLKHGGTLDLCRDFVDWPRTLAGIKFAIHIGAARFIENNGVTRVSVANSELWRALFKHDTVVRSHTFDDYKERRIHSYPVMNVLGFIKEQYTKIGIASALNLPSIELLTGNDSISRIAFSNFPSRERRITFQQDLLAAMRPHAMPPAAPSPLEDFLQVDVFHHTPAPPQTLSEPPPVALAEIDFHQMVSLLGEYPVVLRLMGLAIDFTIDFPVDATATDDLSVEPIWTPAIAEINVTPHTLLDANGSFVAAPRDPLSTDSTRRFLELRSDRFGVVQVDVDGAAIKATNFANR